MTSFAAYRSVPSLFHAPPRGYGASASVWGPPPETAIVLSFLSAKNATNFESGDQNGVSPALASSGLPSRDASGQIHSTCLPSARVPNTTIRPSGDTRGQLEVLKGGPRVARTIN